MAQSHYISNTNVRRREIEFEVDDWVYLNSSPMKGAMRFSNALYVGLYRISKRIKKIAYELELPQELATFIQYFTSPY